MVLWVGIDSKTCMTWKRYITYIWCIDVLLQLGSTYILHPVYQGLIRGDNWLIKVASGFLRNYVVCDTCWLVWLQSGWKPRERKDFLLATNIPPSKQFWKMTFPFGMIYWFIAGYLKSTQWKAFISQASRLSVGEQPIWKESHNRKWLNQGQGDKDLHISLICF